MHFSSTDDLSAKLTQLSARVQRASGALASLTQRKAELTRQVGEAKGRVTLHDDVQRIFKALQERAHERSVGAFERLLSKMLLDVLPHEGAIRLGLSIRNNMPALDVFVEKNGKLEGVYDGNGGGVTNVVCAALRFAALTRAGNRRLMVLDEADNWLSRDRIRPFVGVLADVSRATSTQTFFISHHEASLFEGLVSVVELSLGKDGHPVACLRSPASAVWADDETPGLRGIELTNVRRHRQTFIPCPPGATAFVGTNNLGKSTAILTALRAVAYNESDDSCISHDMDEARVTLHLEKQQRIVWSRKPSRSPVVVYELFVGDDPTPLKQGRPKGRGDAPEWVQDLLGIRRVDDMDIQLVPQKKPVFLLDESASRRAQILSVGRESGHLSGLMKEYDDVRAADRDCIRSGEAELMRLEFRLQAEPTLASAFKLLAEFSSRFKAAELQMRNAEALGSLLKALSAATAQSDALGGLANVRAVPDLPHLRDLGELNSYLMEMSRLSIRNQGLSGVPSLGELPTLQDTLALGGLAAEMGRLSLRQRALNQLPDLQELPTVTDNSELRSTGVALRQLMTKVATLEMVPAIAEAPPALPPNQELADFVKTLAAVTASAVAAQSAFTGCEAELAVLNAEKAQLLAETHGLCPLCGHDIDESALEGHLHETV